MTENSISTAVRKALEQVVVPGGGNLAEFPGLSEIIVTPSALAFAISVAPGMEGAFGPVQAAATEAVQSVAEGRKVLISLTTGQAPSGAGKAGIAPPPQAPNTPQPVPGIKHIIAVASGKGGVGKSTCAVNLALSLLAKGLKVGLLDADLYGPSIPKLLGIEGKPAFREEGIFAPFEPFGLKAMSIGPMVETDQAIVWRGPMASSALRQLLRETDWGELDILIIDLPPGTGDIQISLSQSVTVTGAIIICTPQELALIDAKRAINMFNRVKVPVLGLIENMSFFIAPDTGNRYEIFGHGLARDAAKKLNVPFLGEVPFHMSIRQLSDEGIPIVESDPNGDEAKAFVDIADALIALVPDLKNCFSSPPK